MDKRVYWIISIISILYAVDYEGAKYLSAMIPLYKHLVDFFFITLVFVVGSFGSKFLNDKWQKMLWKYVYVTVIAILIVYGIFDLLHKVENGNLREMFSNLRMFFTTPVPFGILILFSKAAIKHNNGIRPK